MSNDNVVSNVTKVLDVLKTSCIGKRGVFPGVTPAGNYSKNDVFLYSLGNHEELVSELRDEQGLSSINVLTEDGIPATVKTFEKGVIVVSPEYEEEIKRRIAGTGYEILHPRDKGDCF